MQVPQGSTCPETEPHRRTALTARVPRLQAQRVGRSLPGGLQADYHCAALEAWERRGVGGSGPKRGGSKSMHSACATLRAHCHKPAPCPAHPRPSPPSRSPAYPPSRAALASFTIVETLRLTHSSCGGGGGAARLGGCLVQAKLSAQKKHSDKQGEAGPHLEESLLRCPERLPGILGGGRGCGREGRRQAAARQSKRRGHQQQASSLARTPRCSRM